MHTNCYKCSSDRLASVNGKTSDLCSFSLYDEEIDGYVPCDVGLGVGGDCIKITYCLNCGAIQDKFPIPDEQICEALEIEEVPRSYNGRYEDMLKRFNELHEEAKIDIDAMSEVTWKEYRRIGRVLEENEYISEGTVIK